MYGAKEAKPYGAGAFPLNDPTLMDRLFHNKTGYGIWLHGTEGDHLFQQRDVFRSVMKIFRDCAAYTTAKHSNPD